MKRTWLIVTFWKCWNSQTHAIYSNVAKVQAGKFLFVHFTKELLDIWRSPLLFTPTLICPAVSRWKEARVLTFSRSLSFFYCFRMGYGYTQQITDWGKWWGWVQLRAKGNTSVGQHSLWNRLSGTLLVSSVVQGCQTMSCMYDSLKHQLFLQLLLFFIHWFKKKSHWILTLWVFWLINQSYSPTHSSFQHILQVQMQEMAKDLIQAVTGVYGLSGSHLVHIPKKKEILICLLCFTSGVLLPPSAPCYHSSLSLLLPSPTMCFTSSFLSLPQTSTLSTPLICVSLYACISFSIAAVPPPLASFSSPLLSIIPPALPRSPLLSKLIALKLSRLLTSTPLCPPQSHITQFPVVLTSFCT